MFAPQQQQSPQEVEAESRLLSENIETDEASQDRGAFLFRKG